MKKFNFKYNKKDQFFMNCFKRYQGNLSLTKTIKKAINEIINNENKIKPKLSNKNDSSLNFLHCENELRILEKICHDKNMTKTEIIKEIITKAAS